MFGLWKSLYELLTDFCDSVIVVAAIRTRGLKKSKLRFVLLAFYKYLFEVGSVVSYMFGCLFEEF